MNVSLTSSKLLLIRLLNYYYFYITRYGVRCYSNSPKLIAKGRVNRFYASLTLFFILVPQSLLVRKSIYFTGQKSVDAKGKISFHTCSFCSNACCSPGYLWKRARGQGGCSEVYSCLCFTVFLFPSF